MHSDEMACRSCGKWGLEQILDLGNVPLADRLLKPEELQDPEPLFPLEAAFCPRCSLIQLTSTVDPELAYRGDYHYFTSVSPQLVRHFAEGASEIMSDATLFQRPDPLVVEIASNDGSALKPFAQRGYSVLGIDPASAPAAAANRDGIETRTEFFNRDSAQALARENRRADVILGNNVLNLVPDLQDFAEGLKILLKEDGAIVLEVPYALPLIQNSLFDNIFHQNISYFSLTAIDRLFRQFGFKITKVRPIPTFGGSLRVWLRRRGEVEGFVDQMLLHEAEIGIHDPGFYREFADNVRLKAARINDLIDDLRSQGKRIAVYGAAGGMATTLLSYLHLDSTRVDFAVDANPHKQGLFTSGSRLPISSPDRLLADKPDYVLLLAWNFAPEIFSQQERYLREGGRFIIPLPELQVVEWRNGMVSIREEPAGVQREPVDYLEAERK